MYYMRQLYVIQRLINYFKDHPERLKELDVMNFRDSGESAIDNISEEELIAVEHIIQKERARLFREFTDNDPANRDSNTRCWE